MKRLAALLAGIMALGAAAPGPAAKLPSDHDIARQLIGAWMVPTGSSDYSPETANTIEMFRRDGSSTLYVFADRGCTTLLHQATVRWTVRHGTLLSFYGRGGFGAKPDAQDRILAVTKDRLDLQSLEDGTTYSRARADRCGLAPH